ncbi:MAG: hypothetical protein M3355_04530 [Actinomycetota bacterium]|nr:hypothetical protein [Actinomycetota bacterium]
MTKAIRERLTFANVTSSVALVVNKGEGTSSGDAAMRILVSELEGGILWQRESACI